MLFHAADAVRRANVGDAVHLRGIIEFSNYCARNCLYCGLRAGNQTLTRYRLAPSDIVAIAQQGALLGYHTVVLQSGEDAWYTADIMCRIIREIRSRTGLAITLSLGERTPEDYALMRDAGADRYLLKHEVAEPDLYAQLRPGCRFADRRAALQTLRTLGYQVGSGNMVGLPGQTVDMLATDLLFLRDMDVEMAGIGPFIPHPDTPLGETARGTLEMTIKCVAVARLLMPKAHLPATTAIGTIHPQGRQLALKAGANVVMPNLTPTQYRAYYTIYPGKICIGEEARQCSSCVRAMIHTLGRTVGQGPGHSPKSGPWSSGRRELNINMAAPHTRVSQQQ